MRRIELRRKRIHSEGSDAVEFLDTVESLGGIVHTIMNYEL